MANISKEKKELIKEIEKIIGEKLDSSINMFIVYDSLMVELEYDYIWTQVWNKEEQTRIVGELKTINDPYWEMIHDSSLFQRVRAGTLIRALRDDIMHKIKGERKEKVIEYSTHDIMLAPLMSALGIFNNLQPPYGSTLFIELHEDNQIPLTQFIKIWYLNETFSEQPFEMKMPGCYDPTINGCKLSNFLELTNEFLFSDYDKECGISAIESKNDILGVKIGFMIIGFVICLCLLAIVAISFLILRKRKERAEYVSMGSREISSL
jgi:hypothetical protein